MNALKTTLAIVVSVAGVYGYIFSRLLFHSHTLVNQRFPW